jgi:hypothetical protein
MRSQLVTVLHRSLARYFGLHPKRLTMWQRIQFDVVAVLAAGREAAEVFGKYRGAPCHIREVFIDLGQPL